MKTNTEHKYPEPKITLKTGDEHLHCDGAPTDISLHSFWQWSFSDLLNNALRGLLAEYIVASGLGLAKAHRVEWDNFDLVTQDGVRIEVKSAAYLQSWSQKKLSNIQFSIRPTKAWNEAEQVRASRSLRQSDLYVFCLLHHTDQETVDPLNLNQWTFYVVQTSTLNESLGNQKTLSLSRLKSLKPLKLAYAELGEIFA